MISVIIPTYNDARSLPPLLIYLRRVPFYEHISEIIITDGNSTDDTVSIAESFDVKVVRNSTATRASLMNAGAREATGSILYFLHADSLPPKDFVNAIENHYHQGFNGGCFRLQYDHQHWFLRMNAWFTRFNLNWFRFGAQSLFVTRDLFDSLGGFSENHVLVEDQEFIKRIKAVNKFIVIPRYVTNSARKHKENGIYKVQGIYFYISALYRFGVSPELLQKTYRTLTSPKF